MKENEALRLFHDGLPIFAMLQDKNRQNILVTLCCQGPMSVTQLTQKSNLSRPAVSHHLKLLLDAHLVSVDQVGTERFYKVHLTGSIKLLKQLANSLENLNSKNNL